jgi:hypothetical protein
VFSGFRYCAKAFDNSNVGPPDPLAKPAECVSKCRIVISVAAGTTRKPAVARSFGVLAIATFGSLNSGRNRDTGAYGHASANGHTCTDADSGAALHAGLR